MHSRHILLLTLLRLSYVQFRSRATFSVFSPSKSSMSNTPIGHVLQIRSASSPTTFFGNVICGRMR